MKKDYYEKELEKRRLKFEGKRYLISDYINLVSDSRQRNIQSNKILSILLKHYQIPELHKNGEKPTYKYLYNLVYKNAGVRGLIKLEKNIKTALNKTQPKTYKIFKYLGKLEVAIRLYFDKNDFTGLTEAEKSDLLEKSKTYRVKFARLKNDYLKEKNHE